MATGTTIETWMISLIVQGCYIKFRFSASNLYNIARTVVLLSLWKCSVSVWFFSCLLEIVSRFLFHPVFEGPFPEVSRLESLPFLALTRWFFVSLFPRRYRLGANVALHMLHSCSWLFDILLLSIYTKQCSHDTSEYFWRIETIYILQSNALLQPKSTQPYLKIRPFVISCVLSQVNVSPTSIINFSWF